MVLLSHRPDTRSPLLARAAQSVIRLVPLLPEETRALVGSLFGPVAGNAFLRVQDFIVARAGGNPLFVEEIVRNLVSKGVLIREGERWACAAECETLEIPPTLQGLLLSRIDALPMRTRRVLQEAAVDELDQLFGAFARMQRGRAQVVSLVGEAGTGKSRLVG
jgi:adenylate cyclase